MFGVCFFFVIGFFFCLSDFFFFCTFGRGFGRSSLSYNTTDQLTSSYSVCARTTPSTSGRAHHQTKKPRKQAASNQSKGKKSKSGVTAGEAPPPNTKHAKRDVKKATSATMTNGRQKQAKASKGERRGMGETVLCEFVCIRSCDARLHKTGRNAGVIQKIRKQENPRTPPAQTQRKTTLFGITGS